jgi:methylated-DNA-protein-cysteine methyltransferase-like protein
LQGVLLQGLLLQGVLASSRARGQALAMAADPTIDERIWLVVASIPAGQVCSYGDVARLAGLPGAARRVGRALRALPEGSGVPWHRVVGAGGRLSLPADTRAGREQRRRLSAEGVAVSDSGRLPFTACRWQP